MLFANNKNVWPNFSEYLDDTQIISAELSKILINHNVFPEDCSAIGYSKMEVIKKLYSEYYERRIIGFNTFKSKSYTWILKGDKVGTADRTNIGYGYIDGYGVLDTTGTAAGLSTEQLKIKSLSELIEKNESAIFWYTNRFMNIRDNIFLKKYMRHLGMNRVEVFAYCVSELSNMYTVIIICFYKGKFMASGVSSSLSLEKAICQALDEAKMISFVYYGRNITVLPYLKDRKNVKEIYKFIKSKKGGIKAFSSNGGYNYIKLKPWLDDIQYAGLDMFSDCHAKGIRCISQKLLNCMPYKHNLKLMPDKIIVRKYHFLDMVDIFPEYSLL